MMKVLKFKILSENATVPIRGSLLAAGYDLCSTVNCIILFKGKGLVETEIQILLFDSYCGRITPRNGLAWKHSIDVGTGVIN